MKHIDLTTLERKLREGFPCLEASGDNTCKVREAASGCLCAAAADAIRGILDADVEIEAEIWAGDQANTPHEERAVRELYRQRLEIERLRAALRPFAEYGRKQFHDLPVETPVSVVVEPHVVWLENALTVGDFETAKTAFEAEFPRKRDY